MEERHEGRERCVGIEMDRGGCERCTQYYINSQR